MVSLTVLFCSSNTVAIQQRVKYSLSEFIQHSILTTLGKFLDKNCTPESAIIAFKNILISPCAIKAFKCYSRPRVIGGIFRALRSADKLIKAHYFPLK